MVIRRTHMVEIKVWTAYLYSRSARGIAPEWTSYRRTMYTIHHIMVTLHIVTLYTIHTISHGVIRKHYDLYDVLYVYFIFY